MVRVKIKLVNNGKVPVFKHPGEDACCDCYANENVTIEVGKRALIPLGFAIQLPRRYEAVIRPRSGNSKDGIDEIIGTVDRGYTGQVFANIVNNTEETLNINIGDRVCQMAIRKTSNVKFKVVDKLKSSLRGDNGFGSTGKN